MASSLRNLCFLISFSASLLLVSVLSVSSHQFEVGGVNGWTVPSPNHTQSYNLWATLNRFHINDTLHFEYQDDSVLVVNYTDYRDCVVYNPIYRFEDGNTVFEFDRHGFFYFISGWTGHCQAGQKLVVRVMVHPLESDAPGYSPEALSPESGGGESGSADSGPPSLSSSTRTGSGFYLVLTALVGFFVMF